MAESSKRVTNSENDQRILIETAKQFFIENNVVYRKLSVGRKSRDIKDGDLVLPRGCCPNVEDDVLTELQQKLREETARCLLPIDRVTSDKYNSVVLFAQRPNSFRNVIKETLIKGAKYGMFDTQCPEKVVVLSILGNTQDDVDIKGSRIGLELIRSIVLLQHLKKLLNAHGFAVKEKVPKPTSEVKTMYDCFDMNTESNVCPPSSSQLQENVERLCDCKYQEEIKHIVNEPAKCPENCVTTAPVILNIKDYIKENKLCIGKTGYDVNLALIDVRTDDGVSYVVSEAISLSTYLSTIAKSTSNSVTCLHVASQRDAFLNQQIDVTYRLLSSLSNETPCIEQSHFIFGDVTNRSGTDNLSLPALTSQELYSIRYDQMTQSMRMKYGDDVDSENWKDMLRSLTVAGLRFELLSTTARNTVKLDLQESSEGQGLDNRSGSFVMYNCARLATLFKHYTDAVQNGFYPCLPDIEEVKFELLREDEEWILLYNYIYMYPELVKSCIESLSPTSTDIQAKIHTHKVANFLISFSRCLSSYYSRIHILGDCQPHLMQVMFARLYLMKASYQVLQNGLLLMGIQPPSQL